MNVLRRLPASRFSEVLPSWKGVTAVIIGGGPSLTMAQVHMVERAHDMGRVKVIVVNDAYLLLPYADLHYAADSCWHRWHSEGIDKPFLGLTADNVRKAWASFAGEKCTIENSGGNVKDDSVHMLRNVRFPHHCDGLSQHPEALMTGRSSGCQAINLAALAGSRRVVLLGFDSREGQERSHWHGGHPRPMPSNAYQAFRRGFTAIQSDAEKIGLRIINCSPNTAITAFEQAKLSLALLSEEALA